MFLHGRKKDQGYASFTFTAHHSLFYILTFFFFHYIDEIRFGGMGSRSEKMHNAIGENRRQLQIRNHKEARLMLSKKKTAQSQAMLVTEPLEPSLGR